jgi:hypothetical protein
VTKPKEIPIAAKVNLTPHDIQLAYGLSKRFLSRLRQGLIGNGLEGPRHFKLTSKIILYPRHDFEAWFSKFDSERRKRRAA